MVTVQSTSDAYDVAYEYTLRFYPRWFSWVQFNLSSENSERDGTAMSNRLTGPDGMGPEYKIVVAINDDTIYAEAFLDVSNEPVILRIPSYENSYSILQLDVYGNVLSTPLSQNPPSQGGTYAFVKNGYQGQLPREAIRVEMPYSFTSIAIRIDKYSSSGADLISVAGDFRSHLIMVPLSKYNPDDIETGRTLVMPLFFFAASVKMMADQGIAAAPQAFLTTLAKAMASPTTQPLTADDSALIDRFNALFFEAKSTTGTDSRSMRDIIAGAQAAHAALVNRWQSNLGPTNWIHFDNIGQWGTNYLDRAALTEYIQCGNGPSSAYYADAFVDDSGLPLDGASFAYTIQFTKDQIPEAKRFWSVTAYTPGAIELVPNSADKYVVASYTPGLVTASDGSITIYVQADAPTTVGNANWLPVPKGPFSLLLRIYGPEGSAADGSYVPPKIHRGLAR
ncbi:putative exported protein [Minicystis rosea]|nr:putative exported protein [Minicystis rosea]